MQEGVLERQVADTLRFDKATRVGNSGGRDESAKREEEGASEPKSITLHYESTFTHIVDFTVEKANHSEYSSTLDDDQAEEAQLQGQSERRDQPISPSGVSS